MIVIRLLLTNEDELVSVKRQSWKSRRWARGELVIGMWYFPSLLQGGILSPFLFAVYMDDLIDALRNCGCWLYIGSVFTGALLYAADIALLACSCLGLQKLINVVMFTLVWKGYLLKLVCSIQERSTLFEFW